MQTNRMGKKTFLIIYLQKMHNTKHCFIYKTILVSTTKKKQKHEWKQFNRSKISITYF